jgi:hypothetical protein
MQILDIVRELESYVVETFGEESPQHDSVMALKLSLFGSTLAGY